MKSLLSATLATTFAFALGANANADDLVLDLTTKLGVEKTVTVASVDVVDKDQADGASRMTRRIPERLHATEKKFLTLSPSPSRACHPGMLIAIPWQSIKEIGGEKGRNTVTCKDGAKFTGTILTEVTSTDGLKYPLASCSKMTVKKVTMIETKDDFRPAAKCSVRFDGLDQSFEAMGVGYFNNLVTSEKFQMKVGGEEIAGNLSDFEKIVIGGSESGPIRMTVRAPKGKAIEGELMSHGLASLVFEAPNGCAVVLHLRDVLSSRKATFIATIEATKAGERVPKLESAIENPRR